MWVWVKKQMDSLTWCFTAPLWYPKELHIDIWNTHLLTNSRTNRWLLPRPRTHGSLGWSRNWTANLSVTAQPALPELKLFQESLSISVEITIVDFDTNKTLALGLLLFSPRRGLCGPEGLCWGCVPWRGSSRHLAGVWWATTWPHEAPLGRWRWSRETERRISRQMLST